MSIICRHCGGRHNSVSAVQQCAKDFGVIVPEKRTYLAALHSASLKPQRHERGKLPAGFYLITPEIFVNIRIPEEGRWKGRYFAVSGTLDGRAEKGMFDKKEREEFFGWLLANNWEYYMRRYGSTTGYCPACGDKMTSYETRTGFHDYRGPYGNSCTEVVTGKYMIGDKQ